MFEKLDGLVALITGAGSGIGRDLSRHLAENGVVVCGVSRSADKLEALQREIGFCGTFLPVAADVSDYDRMEEVTQTLADRHGKIDLLVNCAGVRAAKPLEALEQSDIDDAVQSMILGAIYCTRHAAPFMMKARRGCILNISSMAGLRGLGNNAVYAACKHAQNGFADSASKYLAEYNVHVVTLCPGGIDTPRWDNAENTWHVNKDQLLQTGELCRLIEHILLAPANTLFKSLAVFPITEAEYW